MQSQTQSDSDSVSAWDPGSASVSPAPAKGQAQARAGTGFMKPLRLTRLDFLTNECTLLGTCVEFGPTKLPVNSFILGLGLGLGLAGLGLGLGLGPTGSWVGPNPTQVPFVACQGQGQASITQQSSHRKSQDVQDQVQDIVIES